MTDFFNAEAGPSSLHPIQEKVARPSSHTQDLSSVPEPTSDSKPLVDTTTKEYIAEKLAHAIIRIQLVGEFAKSHESLVDLPSPPSFRVFTSFLSGMSAVLAIERVEMGSDGEWMKLKGEEEKVVKIRNFASTDDAEAKKTYNEYCITRNVYDSVLEQEKVEPTLMPSQVGRVEQWIAGEWKSCPYIGLVTPLCIPLLTFVEDNATNPDLVILVMMKAALALEAMHSCRYEHLDLKPGNIVVIKSKGEASNFGSYEPRYIELEQTQFVEKGQKNSVVGDTLGYNSQSSFAMHLAHHFKHRAQECREKWGIETVLLDEYLHQATKGHTPKDDLFALGSSFYEVLMICKHKLGYPSGSKHLLNVEKQEAVFRELKGGKLPTYKLFDLMLGEVAKDYRRIWEAKSDQSDLREDKFVGFDKCNKVLEYLLQQSYFSRLFSPSGIRVQREELFEDLLDTVLKDLSTPGSSVHSSRLPTHPENASPGPWINARLTSKAEHHLPYSSPPTLASSSSGPVPKSVSTNLESGSAMEASEDPASGKASKSRGLASKKPYDRETPKNSLPSSGLMSPLPEMKFKGNSSWSCGEDVKVDVTPEGNKWVAQGGGKEPIFEIFVNLKPEYPLKAYSKPWRHGVLFKTSRLVCGFVGCGGASQEGYFACQSIETLKTHCKNDCKATNGIVPEYEAIAPPA